MKTIVEQAAIVAAMIKASIVVTLLAGFSFNATAAEQINQPVAHSQGRGEIVIGGHVPEEQLKDSSSEMVNVEVIFVRQSLVNKY